MKVALVQSELQWENPDANRRHLETLMRGVEADLFVLPEMFSTGFTMTPGRVAEPMSGPTASWMQRLAQQHDAAITGSVVIAEGGHHYNRLLFVLPDGTVRHYDKRHRFTLAGEEKVYGQGKERLAIDYRGIRICPLICYDLRFPVFSRNTDDYDLVLYVANWPAPRIAAWDALLKARAIENVCYAAGVNRVGEDANGHCYPGHSQAFDYGGGSLLEATETENVLVFAVDKEKLQAFRRRFAFLDDRDAFSLIP